MSQTSQALGMPIPEPHVDTWNESMGMVTEALEAIDAFAGDVATVEESPSTAAHSAGEFIIYGGRVYKVTAAIAQGDSLTLGTNVEAASVGGSLTALGGAVDGLESSIATVESVTATSNHAIGDYFMLGNVLMKATVAIAAGETINASKATPATVQGQIDTLWDYVEDLIVVKNVSLGSLTIASGGIANLNPSSAIDAACPTGYKVLGICGFQSNNSRFAFAQLRIYNSVYSVQIINTSSSSQSTSGLGLDVMYLRL